MPEYRGAVSEEKKSIMVSPPSLFTPFRFLIRVLGLLCFAWATAALACGPCGVVVVGLVDATDVAVVGSGEFPRILRDREIMGM